MVKIKTSKKPKGTASQYMTRTHSLRKLQLSLPTFRRLCILKGIYPRHPPNVKKLQAGHRGQTYYYTKDIQFLQHDPMVQTMRSMKVYKRKVKLLCSKAEWSRLEKLEKPRLDLSHVLRERYPTFTDALREMDDTLCHLFLFNALPISSPLPTSSGNTPVIKTHNQYAKILTDDLFPRHMMIKVRAICRAWEEFVERSGLLRKAFLSIKGVYYQISLPTNSKQQQKEQQEQQQQNSSGESDKSAVDITWLTPYPFPASTSSLDNAYTLPSAAAQQMAVDARVMATFLEFYVAMGEAVLGRLYKQWGYTLPRYFERAVTEEVGVDEELDDGSEDVVDGEQKEGEQEGMGEGDAEKNGAKPSSVPRSVRKKVMRQLRSLPEKLQSLDSTNNTTTSTDATESVDQEDEEQEQPQDANDTLTPFNDTQRRILNNSNVFVSREVPVSIFGFILRSMGAHVSYSPTAGPRPNLPESNPMIQYQIVDRDLESMQLLAAQSTTTTTQQQARVFVQPQWIVDSLNRGMLVDAGLYMPGKQLPPHWSPFVEIPEYAGEDHQQQQQTQGEEEAVNDEVQEEVKAEEEEDQDEEQPSTTSTKKSTKNNTEEQERRKMQIMMLSNKKRKLLQKVDKLREHQQGEKDRLQERRKAIMTDKKKRK